MLLRLIWCGLDERMIVSFFHSYPQTAINFLQDTSTISTICTLPSPPPLRSGIYPEDVSMIMYDDQESQLLVIADGVGRLHIVQKPHTPDSQWIYRGFSDQLLDGRPYKLVGFHIQGKLICKLLFHCFHCLIAFILQVP